jgi:hypothetical protein
MLEETISRRQALLAVGAAAVSGARAADVPEITQPVIDRNDAAAERYLRTQITEPGRWRGSVPDDYRMHTAGAAGGLIESMTAALVCPRSKHYQENELVDRIRMAARFLEGAQSTEGNIDLLSTNFNSPPDTGFVVHNVGTAGAIAKRYNADEVLRALRGFLRAAGRGMAAGGIHTPNHRWVVSSALAQINELFPDPGYEQRINQWLAEGVDIDEEGQYIERSTVTYNTVCDRAFTVLAAKLKRPELLDPVRRNLRTMMYLLHPDGEVVTEVSKRQDQFTRGTMAGYWFPLQYLATRDGDGQFATLARDLGAEHARLSTLLEYPDLAAALPASVALPDDYEKQFPLMGLARIRRGPMDGTLVLSGNSRFFSARKGPAVIESVRFATSFFGKGQFVPTADAKQNGGYVLRQSLDAPYYQPLLPPHKVTSKNWGALRERRRKSQICKLEQSATVTERERGFEIRFEARGTDGVPLAIEVTLRDGGELRGCRPAPNVEGAWILERDQASYRVGGAELRFGPGGAPHLWTQLRGAEPRLPGVSVYVTGYTPFDGTMRFEWV